MDSNYRPIRTDKEIRWICSACGNPIYNDKEAVTSGNRILCRECYPAAKKNQEKEQREKYIPVLKAIKGHSAGIYIIGGAFIIIGVLSSVLCVLFLLNMFFDVSLPFVIPESLPIEDWPVLNIVILTFIVSVSGLFLGIQLIFLNPLARKIILLGSFLDIVYALYVVAVALFSGDYFFYIPFVGIFLLFYFNMPDVKRQFCTY